MNFCLIWHRMWTGGIHKRKTCLETLTFLITRSHGFAQRVCLSHIRDSLSHKYIYMLTFRVRNKGGNKSIAKLDVALYHSIEHRILSQKWMSHFVTKLNIAFCRKIGWRTLSQYGTSQCVAQSAFRVTNNATSTKPCMQFLQNGRTISEQTCTFSIASIRRAVTIPTFPRRSCDI